MSGNSQVLLQPKPPAGNTRLGYHQSRHPAQTPVLRDRSNRPVFEIDTVTVSGSRMRYAKRSSWDMSPVERHGTLAHVIVHVHRRCGTGLIEAVFHVDGKPRANVGVTIWPDQMAAKVRSVHTGTPEGAVNVKARSQPTPTLTPIAGWSQAVK
jgi:hypothetical protein